MSAPNYDQIAFDMAFTHLAQQGVKSMSGSTCRYRGGSGLACAIGALMHDEDVGDCDDVPCSTWEKIGEKVPPKVGGLPSLSLLAHLQECHDDVDPESWSENALSLAKLFDLSTATIDALDWSACEATA